MLALEHILYSDLVCKTCSLEGDEITKKSKALSLKPLKYHYCPSMVMSPLDSTRRSCNAFFLFCLFWCDIKSGVNVLCLILKNDQIHPVLVFVFLSGTNCSVQIDAASVKSKLGAYSPQSQLESHLELWALSRNAVISLAMSWLERGTDMPGVWVRP